MNNQIQINDIVKSLDFHFTKDCYYIGKVVSINEENGTFRALTIRRVWEGTDKQFNVGNWFVAPLPDNHLMDGTGFERIEVIA